MIGEAAETQWIRLKWPNGIECPRCGAGNPYNTRRNSGRRFRCRACHKDFYLCSDTVFHHPKKPLEWYENLIHKLIEGNAILKIAGGSLALNKGTFSACSGIFAALPLGENCGHSAPEISTKRPILKISACRECGKLRFWRHKEWNWIEAFVSLPVSDGKIFDVVLTLCLRPQC